MTHSIQVCCDASGRFEALLARINNTNKTISLCVVYRSPASNASLLLQFIMQHLRGKHCLLVGDFNAPEIDWENVSCKLPKDSFDATLLETVLDCNLVQHIRSPTRIIPGQRANILDLVITPSLEDVQDLIIHPPLATSDHCTISFHWTGCGANFLPDRVYRNYRRMDEKNMKIAAESLDWSIPPHLNVDLAWSYLRGRIQALVEEFVPLSKKHQPSRGPPWFNPALRTLLKQRKKAWDHFKLSQLPSDYQRYKFIRNECTRLKRQNRLIHETRIAETAKTSPKTLFAYLQRRNKSATGIPPLRSPSTNELITEDAAKADLLASQFSSVFTTEDDFHPLCAKEGLSDFQFEVETVKALLLSLKPDSAPGPDDIHPRFLKTMADFLAKPLSHIYRLSLDCGHLPKDWKVGTIKPIFKN